MTEPRYLQMPLPRYYAPVWEPLYPPGASTPKAHNQKSCFMGDDYGGHNIPFPVPAPPVPDKYYVNAFYDMSKHVGQLVFDVEPRTMRQRALLAARPAPQQAPQPAAQPAQRVKPAPVKKAVPARAPVQKVQP